MPWITPKTDWTRNDVFIVDPDWNRIKGNMEYLQAFARHLFGNIFFAEIPSINYTVECTDNADSIAKTGMPAFPTPDVVNTIEDGLQALMDASLGYIGFADSIPRYGNGPAWDYGDLNRIESIQLSLYGLLHDESKQRKYIPFILGGADFG